MASEKRLRIKTLAMVLAMVVCANAGDLLLKYGMAQIGAVELTAHGISQAFRLTVASTTIWLAIFFLIGFMVSYMTVLSWADYSYVMPAGAVAARGGSRVSGTCGAERLVLDRRSADGVLVLCPPSFAVLGADKPGDSSVRAQLCRRNGWGKIHSWGRSKHRTVGRSHLGLHRRRAGCSGLTQDPERISMMIAGRLS